jgi:hypothetical protein
VSTTDALDASQNGRYRSLRDCVDVAGFLTGGGVAFGGVARGMVVTTDDTGGGVAGAVSRTEVDASGGGGGGGANATLADSTGGEASEPRRAWVAVEATAACDEVVVRTAKTSTSAAVAVKRNDDPTATGTSHFRREPVRSCVPGLDVSEMIASTSLTRSSAMAKRALGRGSPTSA